MNKVLIGILIFSCGPAFAVERETISFDHSVRGLFTKRNVIEVVSENKGRLATIVSTERDSSVKYHFDIAESQMPNPFQMNAALEVLSKIDHRFFAGLGFPYPQTGHIETFNGVLYGLFMVNKQDPFPQDSFDHGQKRTQGVSGAIGQFGGVYSPKPVDAAILVRIKDKTLEVLKIFDYAIVPVQEFEILAHIHDVISAHAHNELRSKFCEDLLSKGSTAE